MRNQKIFIIVVLGLIVGLLCWLLMALPLNREAKTGNQFPVPDKNELRVDLKASKEVVDLLQTLKEKQDALCKDRTEEIRDAEWEPFQKERLNSLRKVIVKHQNTRASLTAIIAYACLTQGDHKAAVLEALEKLRSQHPETWQAHFAAFLRGGLRSLPVPKSETEWNIYYQHKVASLNMMKAAIPEKEPDIDWNDPELNAFRKLSGRRFVPPIRALFKLTMANGEYNLASAYVGTNRLDRVDHRREWFEKARQSYERVIQEHPNTEHTKEASQMINTIKSRVEQAVSE